MADQGGSGRASQKTGCHARCSLALAVLPLCMIYTLKAAEGRFAPV